MCFYSETLDLMGVGAYHFEAITGVQILGDCKQGIGIFQKREKRNGLRKIQIGILKINAEI